MLEGSALSRYQMLRKRVAPIAFILGMGLLVRHTCQQEERIHATIVISAGEAEARVTALDAKVIVQGETLGTLHRDAQPGMRIGKASFAVALPEADGQVMIDVSLGAETRQVMRRIHAAEGATIELDLSADLK